MRTLGLLLIGLGACASDPPPCDFDKHIYEYETEPISGSCGKLDPNLILPGACPQTMLPATGVCARASQGVCKTTQGTVVANSVLHREDDDSSYSGIVEVIVTDSQGALVCKATYSIKLTQQ